jgi:hypothetical protein
MHLEAMMACKGLGYVLADWYYGKGTGARRLHWKDTSTTPGRRLQLTWLGSLKCINVGIVPYCHSQLLEAVKLQKAVTYAKDTAGAATAGHILSC